MTFHFDKKSEAKNAKKPLKKRFFFYSILLETTQAAFFKKMA